MLRPAESSYRGSVVVKGKPHVHHIGGSTPGRQAGADHGDALPPLPWPSPLGSNAVARVPDKARVPTVAIPKRHERVIPTVLKRTKDSADSDYGPSDKDATWSSHGIRFSPGPELKQFDPFFDADSLLSVSAPAAVEDAPLPQPSPKRTTITVADMAIEVPPPVQRLLDLSGE